jgi:hypothetical protein
MMPAQEVLKHECLCHAEQAYYGSWYQRTITWCAASRRSATLGVVSHTMQVINFSDSYGAQWLQYSYKIDSSKVYAVWWLSNIPGFTAATAAAWL